MKFFKTTISVFEPADAGFAPHPDLYTVAGHIAHAADSVDWFIEGGFGQGWDMEFDALVAKAKAVTSLEEATAWLERAFAHAAEVVGAASDETLFQPMSDTRLMPPRIKRVSESRLVISGIARSHGSSSRLSRGVRTADRKSAGDAVLVTQCIQ